VKFTPDALAGIFLGKISKWNDKAITSANPGVNFPDKEIIVVHRSDGSGTTFIWTDYLSKISPEWKAQVGSDTSVKWPVGLGQKGNEGVAGSLRQMSGAIGYVELIYAVQNNIPYGSVRNAAGVFVKASLEGVTAAAASAPKMPSDFRVSITNAPGKDAYPISSFTWLLIPAQSKDATKGKILADFLNWMVTDGQKMTSALAYAPLPDNVAAKVKDAIRQVK
jgi:phosphate transport system substrate-binding protein